MSKINKKRAALAALLGIIAIECGLIGGCLGYHVGQAQATEIESEQEVVELSEDYVYTDYQSLGEFVITHYCACEKCTIDGDGITATGTKAASGRTIAVDPEVIPYGTTVIIDGHAYVAEDCGGAIKGRRIDIFMGSHQEALKAGVKVAEVFEEV